MGILTLEIPESQVVNWIKHLSPVGVRAVLRAIIPRLDELDALVDYGSQQMRALCAERGVDWDSLTEEERQRLVDGMLHEAEV